MNHQGVKAYVSVSASGDVDVGSNRERFVTRLLPSSLPSLGGRGDVQLLSPSYPSSSMLIQQHSGRGGERNAKLAATAVSTISRLNHPLRASEGRAAVQFCCEDGDDCGKNVFFDSILTFFCV